MSETAVTVWSKIPYRYGESTHRQVLGVLIGGGYAPLAKDEIIIVFP